MITYFTFKSLNNIDSKCDLDALIRLTGYMIKYGTSDIVLEHLLSLINNKNSNTFTDEFIQQNRYKIPTDSLYKSLLEEDI